MSDVKIVRLQTGEDVIAKLDKDTTVIIILKNLLLSFQQSHQSTVQLMMTPYMPYDEDKITISRYEVTTVKPKKEILLVSKIQVHSNTKRRINYRI